MVSSSAYALICGRAVPSRARSSTPGSNGCDYRVIQDVKGYPTEALPVPAPGFVDCASLQHQAYGHGVDFQRQDDAAFDFSLFQAVLALSTQPPSALVALFSGASRVDVRGVAQWLSRRVASSSSAAPRCGTQFARHAGTISAAMC